jgi:hypothetical protein
MSDSLRRVVVSALAVVAYFVAYPEDAQALTAPLATFLSPTTAISPWLYGVAAVAIIAHAVVKVGCGRKGS